jgi:predicted nucleotide-binding protein
MNQHHGTIDELKALVNECNLLGEWSESPTGGNHTFRAKTGEVLNWWPSKGTLQFQGKSQDTFKAAIAAVASKGEIRVTRPAAPATKIFIVHGHDREAREQLELILMKLGLEPFILQNTDSGSRTIVEALEQTIYRDSALGIVLMTPDDFGYSKSGTEADRKPRARQNVILEMGMVMAALSRERMIILKKGAIEMPSDVAGILYSEFNDHVREVVPKLVQRLQQLGFLIDANRIAAASS